MRASLNDMEFDNEPCEFVLQEVVGERVVLRALGEPDVQSLFELIDESRDFLSEHLPWPDECRSGIFEKIPAEKTGEPHEKIAGCIMLGWVQWKHRSATVSYWLGASYCGRGLATEALLLVAGEAFAMGLNRLELSASVNNPKSAAVARRAGFSEEGICREYERIHGHFEDHLRFSLLAKDFC